MASNDSNAGGGTIFGGGAAEAGSFAKAGFPPIRRRERISMRDPQQAINDIELEVFRRSSGDIVETPVLGARRIIDEARVTAEQMLVQARAACDAELRAAREEGYAIGFGQGLAEADREVADLIATAEAIATNVAREREELLARSEGEIVELAMHVARRIVNATVSVDPSVVVEVCRGAMRRAFQRDTLVVLAHPDDLAALREAGPAMAAQLGGVHSLDFVEERRLERGGVIVRTPVGEIDATFNAKAEKIEYALREHAEQRRATRNSVQLPTASGSAQYEQSFDERTATVEPASDDSSLPGDVADAA